MLEQVKEPGKSRIKEERLDMSQPTTRMGKISSTKDLGEGRIQIQVEGIEPQLVVDQVRLQVGQFVEVSFDPTTRTGTVTKLIPEGGASTSVVASNTPQPQKQDW